MHCVESIAFGLVGLGGCSDQRVGREPGCLVIKAPLALPGRRTRSGISERIRWWNGSNASGKGVRASKTNKQQNIEANVLQVES